MSENINSNSIIYDLRSKNTVMGRILYLINKTVTGKIILLFIIIFILQYFIYEYLTGTYLSGSDIYSEKWKNIFGVRTENINILNLILSIFSHANLTHLFINSTILLSFGIVIEDFIKSSTYISLFILGGVISTISQISFVMISYQFNLLHLYSNEVLVLGASGAILSVIGASTIKQPDAKVRVIIFPFIKFTMVQMSVIFIFTSIVIINVFGIAAFNISHVSHISGLLFGYWFGFNRFSTIPIKKYFD